MKLHVTQCIKYGETNNQDNFQVLKLTNEK